MQRFRRDIGLFSTVCALGFVIAAGVYKVLARTPGLADGAAVAALLILAAFTVPLAAFYFRTKEKEKAEREFREQNRRLNAVLANMPLGISMFGADNRLALCNDQFRAMYDMPAEVARPGALREAVAARMAAYGVRSGAAASATSVHELTDGRVLAITEREIQGGGWVVVHNDISELRRIEAEIAHLARHDSLTGLPNRTLFRERLDALFAELDADARFAVLCLDLDQFKHVNDSLGQPAGDRLLKDVAARMRKCIGKDDMLARLGGDEFVVLRTAGDQPTDAAALAQRLAERLGRPFDLDGREVAIEASIGIAIAPQDGGDPDRLLYNADLALNLAKSDGRGRHRFFEAGMDGRMRARRRLEAELRSAIRYGEFELFYQPLLDAKEEAIAGVEALLRWRHPERGLVSPMEFIPLAEETGLIVPLGEWVIRRACADAAEWPEEVSVSVNLAAAQFEAGNLVPIVVSALSTAGLSARRLVLEITETALLEDTQATLETLHMLRGLGVRIAMDDFGTGYSSLSYLRSFPFDKIKIDRSFVKDLPNDPDTLAIVKAVATLGATLGMELTAEGVETEEQLRLVRAEGYTEIQGNYYGKPQPAMEIARLLAPLRKAVAG
jgi:diguanylate cyclase (GGDEF)-like protein